MKIAFFEVGAEEKVFFKNALDGHELYFYEETINDVVQDTMPFEVVSVFVHSRIDDNILQKLPNLHYLQTRSTGFDHIKCKTLYDRKILVSNVSGYAGPPVGEFAFSLLLNAIRKTHIALQRSKAGEFYYQDLLGSELFGKKITILGLGVIGERMVRIASGFGMEICVFSRTKKPIVDELGICFSTNLNDVLPGCDVLMIALPLTPATRELINTKNVKMLGKETIIVNVARAEILEESLYETLPNTICTDVLTNVKNARRENILYTPHMAYYTKEALERIREISLKNILAFLAHKPLPNCLKIVCEKEYS